MKVKISRGEVIETDDASTQDLQALRDLMILDAQQLRSRIAEEWQKYKENDNVYPDPMLYNRLQVARKRTGQAIEKLNAALGDRRRKENITLSNQVHDAFVRICQERMPKELFVALIDEAKRRVERDAAALPEEQAKTQ